MEKSIRVRILNREYPLRVQEHDEGPTRQMAAYVDARMRAFKQAHPDQPEVVAAVMVALAFAEELQSSRDAHDHLLAALDTLDADLAQALAPASGPNGTA